MVTITVSCVISSYLTLNNIVKKNIKKSNNNNNDNDNNDNNDNYDDNDNRTMMMTVVM